MPWKEKSLCQSGIVVKRRQNACNERNESWNNSFLSVQCEPQAFFLFYITTNKQRAGKDHFLWKNEDIFKFEASALSLGFFAFTCWMVLMTLFSFGSAALWDTLFPFGIDSLTFISLGSGIFNFDLRGQEKRSGWASKQRRGKRNWKAYRSFARSCCGRNSPRYFTA